MESVKAAALAFTLLFSVSSAFGCGGWFPNDLLSSGGNQLLAAPEATFSREIAFLQLVKPVRPAVPATNSYPEEAAAAELAELRTTLAQAGRSENEIESIITQHAAQRSILIQFAQAHETWRAQQNSWQPSTNPAPTLRPDAVRTVNGLPGEFADYFQGALA